MTFEPAFILVVSLLVLTSAVPSVAAEDYQIDWKFGSFDVLPAATIRPGDSVVFRWVGSASSHAVQEVTKDQFKTCEVPDGVSLLQDEFTFKANGTGVRYFVCPVNTGANCKAGMKIRIEVTNRVRACTYGDPCCFDDWFYTGYRGAPKAIRINRLEWIRQCLRSSSINYHRSQVIKTLDQVSMMLRNFYSYFDVVHGSSQGYAGSLFPVAAVSVPIDDELAALRDKEFRNFYDVHETFLEIFSRMKDAHTTYVARPMASFWFARVVRFSSSFDAGTGKQVFFLNEINDRLPAIPGGVPLPGVAAAQRNLRKPIKSVNGADVGVYFESWLARICVYKDLSACLNGEMMGSGDWSLGTTLLPEYDEEVIVFEDGSTISMPFVVWTAQDLTNSSSLLQHLQEFTVDASAGAGEDLFDVILNEEILKAGAVNASADSLPGDGASSEEARRSFAYDSVSPVLEYKAPGDSSPSQTLVFFYMQDSNVGVLKITTFNWDILEDLDGFLDFWNRLSAYAQAHDVAHLMIDVIGNGGGVVRTGYYMLALLVKEWSGFEGLCEHYDLRVGDFQHQWYNTYEKDAEELDALVTNRKQELLGDPSRLRHYARQLLRACAALRLCGAEDAGIDLDSTEPEAIWDALVARVNGLRNRVAMLRERQLSSDGTIASFKDVMENLAEFTRGGRVGQYSPKFYLACDPAWKVSADYYFDRLSILTDGTCGSTCALFTTRMRLSSRATVVTFGGFVGRPPNVASFAGGNVESYSDFWKPLALYAAGLYAITGEPLSEYVVPFSTGGDFQFAYSEIYASELGDAALPREWYLIPGHVHMNIWPEKDLASWPTDEPLALAQLYRSTVEQLAAGHEAMRCCDGSDGDHVAVAALAVCFAIALLGCCVLLYLQFLQKRFPLPFSGPKSESPSSESASMEAMHTL